MGDKNVAFTKSANQPETEFSLVRHFGAEPDEGCCCVLDLAVAKGNL